MTVFLIVIGISVVALTIAVRLAARDPVAPQRYAPCLDEWSPDLPSRPYGMDGLAR